MLSAKPDCCQEAAMGVGDAYLPCNKPATQIIRWKGRSDAPVRMCDMCADHNVKNRGGFVVSAYPPPDSVETVPAPRKRGPKVTQVCEYPADVVERHKSKLPKPYYDILLEAAGTRDYKTISSALGIVSLGTVKSRLNRARAKLASLIEGGNLDGTSGQDRDGYSDSQDRESYIVDEEETA